MGKQYEELSSALIDFIADQKMFFVGTAPLSQSGHINVSPKGMDSLRVIDPNTVAYLDGTGSGVETIAHVKENGRLLIMFCAFADKPLIVRLHGQGRVVETHEPEFQALSELFPTMDAARAIIVLNISRISDSCGWTVPLYEYTGTRDYYQKFAENLGEDGLRNAQAAYNMESIDGLPGLSKPSV